MIINCKLFNKEVIALIDTGATHSVLSSSFVKKNNLEQYVDYHSELKIVGVNPISNSNGIIWHTYLYFGEQCFPIFLSIIDLQQVQQGKSEIDMIIGMDILSLYDIKLVPKDNTLILNGIEIHCHSY